MYNIDKENKKSSLIVRLDEKRKNLSIKRRLFYGKKYR